MRSTFQRKIYRLQFAQVRACTLIVQKTHTRSESTGFPATQKSPAPGSELSSIHLFQRFNTKHANNSNNVGARVHEPCIQVDVYAQKQIPTWQIDSAKTAQSHFLQASMAGTGKIPI